MAFCLFYDFEDFSLCFNIFSGFKDSSFIQKAFSGHFVLLHLIFYAAVIYLVHCTIVFYC